MKVFLVNPACLDTRMTDEDALAVPIGLFYIGALLKSEEFEVEVINLAPSKKPIDTLLHLVATHQPGLIGFSVLHANRHCAMDAVAAVKKENPDIVTVFGGPAATFSSELLLKQCPGLDFIIKGEGENRFLELVRSIDGKDGNSERGDLDALGAGRVLENAQDAPISDLDTLPHPAAYFDFQHLSLSRGCPGNCRFCGSPDFWGKGKVRFHSAKWFVDEMALLIKQGRTHFFISDDTFTMSKKRVLEVCKEIRTRNLDVTWQAISRVDFIDDEILTEMRKAGCIQISYGVESGSEKIRKVLGKPFKNGKIIKAFHRTVAHGILPRAYFIYGSPGETKKTVQQSVDLIQKIRPLSMVSYILVLFPGTAIYNECVAQKTISSTAWEKRVEDIPWFEVDPNLNFDQVRQFGKQIRKEFYAKVHRFAQKIELVKDKTLYPFHADFLSRLAMTFSHGEYAAHPDVMQQDQTAEILYRKALRYAHDPRAYLGLAMLMQKRKDFPSAVSVLEPALNRFPAHQQLCICMAVSLMNMGRFKPALDYLEPFTPHPDVMPYVDVCHQRLKGTS